MATKPKPKTKAAPKTKTKAKTKAKPAANSHKAALATLIKALKGKRASCELLWFSKPREMAAKVFDWKTIDAGEREDLLSDTFNDGIIEAFMEDGDDGHRFRAFAIPFAYVGALPEQVSDDDDGDDWIGQPDGLLICDTRDGSVHLVHIDGTAMVEDVKRVAPTLAQLDLQALG